MNSSVKILDLTAGGGTENIPAYNPFAYTLLLSTATFTSSWTIQGSGTPKQGMREIFVYRGAADFDGNTLTIYGKVVPAHLEAKPWVAVVTYNGSSWDVTITADTVDTQTIDAAALVDVSILTAKIADSAVTFEKLESLVEGEIIIGNSSNIASEFFAGGADKFLIGNGTTLLSVAISGDILIPSTGIAAIQPGVVTEAMLAFSLGNLLVTSAKLTQAQFEALNTTPIEILSDAVVGVNDMVKVAGAVVSYTFADSAVAWLGNMQVQTNTGAILLNILEADLENGSSKNWDVPNVTQRDLVKNTGLRLQAAGGDPAGGGGDSTYEVFVFYTITTTT